MKGKSKEKLHQSVHRLQFFSDLWDNVNISIR